MTIVSLLSNLSSHVKESLQNGNAHCFVILDLIHLIPFSILFFPRLEDHDLFKILCTLSLPELYSQVPVLIFFFFFALITMRKAEFCQHFFRRYVLVCFKGSFFIFESQKFTFCVRGQQFVRKTLF